MEKSVEETLAVLRKSCESAKGKMVTVAADDIVSVLDHLQGKPAAKAVPAKIES